MTTIKQIVFNPLRSSQETDESPAKPTLSQERIQRLVHLIFPLTKPATDKHGNTVQLWSVPESRIVAILNRADGSSRYISSTHIHNPLNPEEDPVTLHNKMLTAPNCCRWDFVIKEDGSLVIWPHLKAAGWRDAIPMPNLDFSGLASLARGRTREQMCGWFYTNGYRVAEHTQHTRVEIHLHHGGFAGTYNANEHQTIQHLLRQGGYIKAIHHNPPGDSAIKEGFVGKGIVFSHPRDKNHTSFNVDYSKAIRKDNGQWDAEEKGGYHIDVKVGQKTAKVKISTEETYYANHQARKAGKSAPYEAGLPPPPKTPASKNFEARLQQTKLTDSYNATHKHNPVPPKGTGGVIGGVACSTDYIEGLFDSPESLFEEEHYFFLPQVAGEATVPFSNQELQQILRELSIGIYAHSAVPFFSLHFNQDLDLFPVIHPVYENTLVGRVIGMLDYIMKGYLNGGIFEDEFIDAWGRDPNWKSNPDSALKKLIDFKEYCESKLQGEDKSYKSLREYLHLARLQIENPEGIEGKIGQALGAIGSMQQDEEEPEILKHFHGFSNSFRIIAKQNSVKKEGQVFVIDADFDVLYTINPSPAYQAALELYQRKHGKLPPSYQVMQRAYELFCKQIHDHMVKLPLCREYFSMLAMINFFSGYFSTLKKHRKIPRLPSLEIGETKGCPSLFPYLPIRNYSKEKVVYFPLRHMKEMLNSSRPLMEKYLIQQLKRHRNPSFIFSSEYDVRLQEEVLKPWEVAFRKVILESVSPSLRRSLIKSDFKEFKSLPSASLESMANSLAAWLCENPSLNNQNEVSVIRKFIADNIDRGHNFLEKAGAVILFAGAPSIETQQIFEKAFKEHSSSQKIELDTAGRLSTLELKSELSPEELEEGKRVVGGCGIQLEKHQIEPSPEAASIWQNNWGLFQSLKPEMWQPVASDDAKGRQGAIFRLEIEDVPPEVDNDYTWMETLLLIPQGQSPALVENHWEIAGTIAADNVEGFSRLINEVTGLAKMRDRYGRTLLHEAILADNPYYLEALLAKGLSCSEEDGQGNLPIHYAAMKGNVRQLEILFGHPPASLNATNHSGATPLTVASQHQQTQAVRWLLSKKPKLLVSTEGYTPFHSALHEGHPETIRAFFDHPDLILSVLNVLAEEGGTPLMLACELDSLEFVDRLLKMGANPKIARKDGITAMEISILRHCDPILQCLLAHASPTDRVIEAAATEGSVKTIELLGQFPLLLTYRNAYQDTALHLMIRSGNIQVALGFIGKCTDPDFLNAKNRGKETAFSLAASLGLWQLVDALYQKRVEIDLSLLFKAEYHPLLKEIFDARTVSDPDLQYYLSIAAQAGNYMAITQVLEPKGAKLANIEGSHGWQLLHYLAKADGIFLFRRLIGQPSNYLQPIKEEGGKTLAYIAAEYGSSRIFKFLLENFKRLGTPLHNHFKDRHLLYGVMESRSINQCKQMLEMFKEDHLESAELDADRTCPVHLAARLGLLEIFHLLDKCSVDFTVQDRHGFTPLDYAVRAGADNVVQYLLTKGKGSVITPRALFMAANKKNEEIRKQILLHHPSQDVLNRALILAIENNDDEAFLVLLQEGASLDYMTLEGWTPLLLASQKGQFKILKEILKRDPANKKKINGNGPLHLASIRGNTHCVRLLLEAGHQDEPNGQGNTASDLASSNQGIQTLLKDPRNASYQRIEAFALAIQQGDVNAITEIMEKLPPDEEIFLESRQMCGTPLQLLIQLGVKKSTIVYLLKEFKGNPNLQDSDGNTLAHLLLKAGISPLEIPNIDLSIVNHSGQTPLHLAARFATPKVVEQLLEKLNPSSLEIIDKNGLTPIFYAIDDNRAEIVRFLSQKGTNLRHAAHHLTTPLMYACQKEALSAARILLEEGADPNQAGNLKGWTPLCFESGRNNVEIALSLLAAGAKIDKKADDGTRVIHFAAVGENHLLMRLFSAQGYSLKVKDNLGMQPIHLAASHGKTDALRTISALDAETIHSPLDALEKDDHENKSRTSFKGASPLHFAARFGTAETVKTLLDLRANPEAKTADGTSTLSLAAANESSISVLGQLYAYKFAQKPEEVSQATQSAIVNDNIDAVISLYSQGVLINGEIIEGYSGLHLACMRSALQTTQWLLRQGADPFHPCSTGQNAFEISAVHGDYESFSLLLEYAQPDLDQLSGRGEALIHMIARAGKLRHIMLLILYGAFINKKNIRGETPLHLAVKEGHLPIVRLLLACGADMFARTEQGKTAFDLASMSPDDSINKALMEFQRILQEANKDETLLHRAVRLQEPLAVMILTHFQNVDLPDSEGITPLHLAVQMGQMPSVINLLQRGAKVNIADKQGRTPLQAASIQSPNPVLVKLLVEAGADPMARDKSGMTVYEQVQKLEFPKKAQVLEIFNKKMKKN